jgi:hypothetical protein
VRSLTIEQFSGFLPVGGKGGERGSVNPELFLSVFRLKREICRKPGIKKKPDSSSI